MIQGNELRIGNWVSVRGSLVRVESLDSDSVNLVGEDKFGRLYGHPLKDEVEPVPLTEKILEETGFQWLPHTHKWVKNGFTLTQNGGGFYNAMGYESFVPPKIKYVHELQNLYFVLKGKDLEIRL